MSASTEIIVIRSARGWSLLAGSGQWGRYASIDDALQAGRRILHRELAQGRACSLLIQDGSGRRRRAII